MSPIITLTVNPCIDISIHLDVLKPDKKLRCTRQKKEPGGGGINVSRVVERFGGNTIAYYLAGGYTGKHFTELLELEGVKTRCIEIGEHTRENFVVKEDSTNLQYRFGMPGPFVKEEEWKKCLLELEELEDMDFIVASGSIAFGLPDDFFARLGDIAKKKNKRLILDTTGEPLKLALQSGVYMIKPNLGELATLAGVKELSKQDAIAAAKEIISKKQCEVVVVSMGGGGALLVTDTIAEHVSAPVIEVKSTVGAGDSMVAGIVLALSENKSIHEAIRYGVACGAAATINDGTALCSIADVERLLKS